MKNLILFALCLFAFSCKKQIEDKSITQTIDDSQFIKEVDALPAINSPNISQLIVKKIDYTLAIAGQLNPSAFSQQYSYYSDGKIKNFSDNSSPAVFLYENNQLTVNSSPYSGTYKLDGDGFASVNSGYFFKNGFLIRDRDKLKKKYSADGNMISYNDGEFKATYEYTSFPNNIRQEITQTQTPHLSKRDLFLGKFSANLVKKAVFDDSFIKTEMNFTYEFDDQNRVSKIVIKRTFADIFSTITYIYHY